MGAGHCEECGQKQRFALQPKLKITAPGDIHEQEADRVADQVMAAATQSAVNGAPPSIQRLAGHPAGQIGVGPSSVDRALVSPGHRLSPALRQVKEQRFGYELHADSINTLKMRRTPRFVDLTIQALTSGALAGIGASLGVRQRKLSAWVPWATALALLAVYAGVTVALAASDDVLLYSTYDIAAFVFAYALYRHLSKRWLP